MKTYTYTAKELAFTPKSSYKTFNDNKYVLHPDNMSIDELFRFWQSVDDINTISDWDKHVVNGYHPIVLFKAQMATILYSAGYEKTIYTKYNKYANDFLKDPVNKFKGAKPIDAKTYFQTQTKDSQFTYIPSNAYQEFAKKFSKDEIDDFKKALFDYITLEEDEIDYPKNILKYLQS